MPSSQETEWTYSTPPDLHRGWEYVEGATGLRNKAHTHAHTWLG